MSRIAALLIVITFCGHLLSEEGAPPPLLDRALFFSDPEYSCATISPDGRYISFLRSLDGVTNIWVMGTNEPIEAARPVTNESGRPIVSHFWSKDSSHLLFLKEVDGPGCHHLFSVALPTSKISSKARDLTPVRSAFAQLLAISKEQPEFVYVALNTRKNWYRDVYRINLKTGTKERIFLNTENIVYWHFDQKCQLRLGQRITQNGTVELLRINGQTLTPIFSYNVEENFRFLCFHKDGKRFYAESSCDTDRSRLVLVDIETGLCKECDSDPEGKADLSRIVIEDGELCATVYVGEKGRIYCKNEKTAQRYEKFRKRFPEEEIRFEDISDDGRYRLVEVSSDTEPGAVYLYDEVRDTCSFVYRSIPFLPSQYLCPMRPIRYRARDGLGISGYLTLPAGMPEQNLPVVVFPHAGPNERNTWSFDPHVQFFANRGYAVLQVNFRGSVSYGKRFLDAGNKQWGNAMQHDITDGVTYLVNEKIADPSRIAIYGQAYGGFASLAALAFTPNLYACGIACSAPSNIVSLLKTPAIARSPAKRLTDLRIGNLGDEEDRVRMKRYSPFYSVDTICAPLLLLQGEKDIYLPEAESEQIANTLKQKDQKVTYMTVSGEGHEFLNSENRIAVAQVAEYFLAQHLKGRCQKENLSLLRKLRVIVHN